MTTELFYRDTFIGSFPNYQAAVHHYVDELFVNGVDVFCKDVVLHSEDSYCQIRSQFKGTRKANDFMVSSRFGGILFDYFKPTYSGPSNMARVTKAVRIRKEVLTIIAEQFGVKIDTIQDSDTAIALGGDSLDEVECLMCLEEHFEHEISEEEADAWKTVGDCIKFFTNGFKNDEPVETVPVVKELDVPCMSAFGHRAEVGFKQAKYAFSVAVRKQLTKVGDAEQKATDKALAGVEKLIKLTTTIAAENKASPKVVVKQPLLRSIHYYLVRKARGVCEVVAGPFGFRDKGRSAIRTYLMKNATVDPRTVHLVMGDQLNRGKFTVAAGLSLPLVAASVQQRIKPKTTPAQSASRKAHQAAVMARRAAIRADRLVQQACAFVPSKLYVVDNKRNRVVAGPYSKHKEASALASGQKHLIVLTGTQCRNEDLKYLLGFKPVTAPRVTANMFAVGVTIMVAAVRAKITTYDTKTKTVVTNLGTVHSTDSFTLNFPKALLAVA
jgi:acyl carrier protein